MFIGIKMNCYWIRFRPSEQQYTFIYTGCIVDILIWIYILLPPLWLHRKYDVNSITLAMNAKGVYPYSRFLDICWSYVSHWSWNKEHYRYMNCWPFRNMRVHPRRLVGLVLLDLSFYMYICRSLFARLCMFLQLQLRCLFFFDVHILIISIVSSSSS